MGKRKTTEEFVSSSLELHGNVYDYSLVEYINAYTKVKIICRIHGDFEITPHSHNKGHGCPVCAKEKRLIKLKESNKRLNDVGRKTFLFKSIKCHGDLYDYSLVDYKNNSTKVKIICKYHGVFEQSPTHHYNGHGCPICKVSKGERKVMEVLKSYDIPFECEKVFDGLVSEKGNYLRFDFAVESLNLLIEYDGEQHFRFMKGWYTKEDFDKLKYHDKLKNEFCKKHGINLLRIKYTDFDIIKEIIEGIL